MPLRSPRNTRFGNVPRIQNGLSRAFFNATSMTPGHLTDGHLTDGHLADGTTGRSWDVLIISDQFRPFSINFEKCVYQKYCLPNVPLSNVLEPLLLVLHSGLQQPASLFFMKYRYRSLSYSHIGMIHSDTYEYFLYNCNLYVFTLVHVICLTVVKHLPS